jgi:hypothetical protein
VKSTPPSSRLNIDHRWIWMILGLGSWLLHKLLCANPSFTEIAYSRGFFLLLRNLYDYTLGWSPIPMIYLLLLGLLIRWGWKWRKRRKNPPPKRNWRSRLASVTLGLLALAGGLITIFYWSWGYNYCRQPIEAHLSLPVGEIDSLTIDQEFFLATEEVIAARAAIPGVDTSALDASFFPEHNEAHMRAALIEVLTEMDYPTPGRVRGRRLFPKGLLYQLGASGIYLPFVGEGHIDAALTPMSQPFVLAHELGHGYGFGEEGTCNFLGYLACLQSEDPAVQYAGKLAYWRETAVLYRRLHPTLYPETRKSLPPGMVADLNMIYAVLQKYPGFFPTFSRLFYDSYLKSQGIEEGSVSYSRVVALVAAWRKRAGRP